MIKVMDQCTENASELRQWIRSDTIRVIVQRACVYSSTVTEINVRRGNNPGKELDNTHCHMGGMLKVVN